MQSEGHDIAAEYRQWESWYAYINAEIAPVPGVKTRVIPPAGASPFPVLEIAWDSSRIGMTAGGLYKLLLDGPAHHVARRRRRLFVHPEPVAMKPWRHS